MSATRVGLTVALLIGVSVFSYSSAETERWLCVAEKATGYIFSDLTTRWERAAFKASDKYLVAPGPPKPDQPVQYLVRKIGDPSYVYLKCRDFVGDMLHCESPLLFLPFYESFSFNTKTLRYVYTFTGSWLKEKPEGGGDTPLIELGKCSPL